MQVSAKRMAVLREHIRAESEHDMDALLGGMTPDCFNDVVGVPKPFVGPEQTAERYRKHWEGFPDFTVRVRRVLCADGSCVVTENEWRGTHLGTFLGWPPTGKPVKIRAVVVWHFKGDDLWGETIFFDIASILKQIGAQDRYSAALGLHEAGHVHARQHAAHWSRNGIRVNPCLGASTNCETLLR